jgi:hypothetical protein
VPDPEAGVVEGVVDGVDPPPMFGQPAEEWVAAVESMVDAGVVEVGFAELEELVAACATAPPASTAETAKAAITCLERGSISVHLLSWAATQSTSAP